jgi:CheY-like chemotaxis protein
MKSLSILLIDGNEIEREKFQKVCEEVNFLCDVLEATSGEQALSYLNGFENTVNVIILDLHMPQMNGLYFLEKLKSNINYRNTPVVIMSNSEDYADLDKCYDQGVVGYLNKPIDFTAYSQKVKSLLNYWQQNEFVT